MVRKNDRLERVFVGLSGGVDSSVAAYLLKKQGYHVVGVHLRCWNRGGCDVREAEYARRVAEHLGIPFYIFNLEKEYKKAVVDYMIAGYEKGITPNPDVMCNKEIKFGLFLKKALELGADYVATGHYVKKFKVQSSKLKVKDALHVAKDKSKDQSYFLWTLTQDQLKHCLFPIGGYLKSEVRAIAKRASLPTAEKKDSQGICFIGQVSIKDFLTEYLPKKKGRIIDESGEDLGYHDGVQFYTIGQRHGLRIGGAREPYYVAEKKVSTNTLVVAKGSSNEALYRKEVLLTNINTITPIPTSIIRTLARRSLGEVGNKPMRVMCRVRYRQPLFSASLYKLSATNYKLIFDKPQRFIAPGQSAVIYKATHSTGSGSKSGDFEMLGGGVIV